jgi:hypothetical protein
MGGNIRCDRSDGIEAREKMSRELNFVCSWDGKGFRRFHRGRISSPFMFRRQVELLTGGQAE